MWISEDEASIRLGSGKNLLNRVRRDSDYDSTTLEPSVPVLEELSDGEILSHCEKATEKARKRSPYLSHREAADAVIIGQVAGRNLAAELYQKQPEHITLMTSIQNQGHDFKRPPILADLIDAQRTKIRDAAFKRLNTVMECLDEDKIKAVSKARDLGVIGLQLSTIAEKMLPKDMQAEQSVHFHMFRPEVKSESAYDTVTVGEERIVNTTPTIDGEVSDK